VQNLNLFVELFVVLETVALPFDSVETRLRHPEWQHYIYDLWNYGDTTLNRITVTPHLIGPYLNPQCIQYRCRHHLA
jgi:hypothetical protein